MCAKVSSLSGRLDLLKKVLEEAYRHAERPTRNTIAKFTVVDLGWDTVHTDLFNGHQSQLQDFIKTAQTDPTRCPCVRSDTTKAFWA